MKDRKKSEQTSGNDESLDKYENRLGQHGSSPYIYIMFYGQRLFDGVLNHFAER